MIKWLKIYLIKRYLMDIEWKVLTESAQDIIPKYNFDGSTKNYCILFRTSMMI